MSKIHRIINNAIWFTLFGPLVGLIIAIPTIYINMDYPSDYFHDLPKYLLIGLLIAYIWGSLPALATGIILACLPPSYQGLPLAALIGALASALLPITAFIIVGYGIDMLLISVLCGTLSSVVVYQSIHYLPAINSQK
ncbi:hypothetical protein [Limnobaculum parvum]|nr:hypothetical protein [Limnobaculum parvum]